VSQKIRLGNTYWHDLHDCEVLTVHHDDQNYVWYRKVESRDNAGVIATRDGLHQQEYSEFLGHVNMRDYPEDAVWQEMREAVLERDEFTCQGCATDVEPDAPIHHIVPLGCGGTNTYRNLITLCQTCHGKVHGGPI